jgi:subtilase family serine protease
MSLRVTRNSRTALSLLIASALGAATFAAVPAHAAGTWSATATQATPVPSLGTMSINPTQQLHVVVGLAPRNKAQLDTLVAAISTPGNAQFGHAITPAQFLANFAPTTSQTQAVVSYLASQGFTNIELSANNLTVSAYGSAASVQSAFNTQLVSFLSQGRSVFANIAPAQVPTSLGGIVTAVIGLQNVGIMATPLVRAVGVPQDPILTPPYSGPQYQVAYDAGTTPTGFGTTIAIITEGDITQVPKDLRTYEAEFHLPQVPYEIVPTGMQSSDTAGTDEWDMDSQASSGIAGNLKKIIFYNSGSLADVDMIPAYERIVSENRVKAVNMSFGGCETIEYLSGGMMVADLAYEQGAAQGITFFASSGDGGASCQVIANAGQPMVLSEVEYPASSEYVVAVGGTSLLTNGDYSYDAETSWDSGGGGISKWEIPGGWTSGVIPPVNTTGGFRAVPDVAMVGDPNIGGADVVVNGSDTGIGGTSLSSPLAVGTWARLQSAHGNCYGFAAPIFYSTFGQPFGTAAKDFHDIIVGDNFLYTALPGWDFTTGLGTFDIALVNADMPQISCPPDEAPSNLSGKAVNGQVVLNWSAADFATSYAVYAGSASGAEGSSPFATATGTSLTIGNLAPGQTYYFTVKAVNAGGSSNASNEASVAIPLPPPPAPTSLAGTAGNGVATLTWTAASGATSYAVYEGTTAGGESATPVASGLTGSSATISGLRNGSTYYFVVRASNSGGSSGNSNEATVALPAAPAAPTSVTGTTAKISGGIKLSWTAVTGAAHYNVYVGTASNGEGTAPKLSNLAGTTATLSGLVSGQRYYFQVTALAADGAESAKSKEGSAVAR